MNPNIEFLNPDEFPWLYSRNFDQGDLFEKEKRHLPMKGLY